jgi:plasmid stabilization system protein ParE
LSQPALPVVFTRRATRQIEEASAWWEENRPAARGAVHEDLVRAISLIAMQPGCGARSVSSRLRGVRRILLERIGYVLYYRIAPRKRRLEVLAFWHARRGSKPVV